MKQVMKSKANITTTGGNNWVWSLAGSDSVARAATGDILTRQHSQAGRRSWVWSGAGFKNLTRTGDK